MSNNSFDPSNFPPWLSTLSALTTMYVFQQALPFSTLSFISFPFLHSFVYQLSLSLTGFNFQHLNSHTFLLYGRMMEDIKLQGVIPVSLFNLQQLQTV